MKLECPYCHADIVRRTKVAGPVERLSNLLSFYSFRCQLCGHRFRTRVSGSEMSLPPGTLSVDKRRFERLSTNVPARIADAPDGSHDVITDLSIAGCTLHTARALERGAFVRIGLYPARHEPAIFVETAMVRSIRYQTVGLEFLEFEQEQKERLGHFLRGLFRQQTADAMA